MRHFGIIKEGTINKSEFNRWWKNRQIPASRNGLKEIGGTMPENLPTPSKSIKQIESKQGKVLIKKNK